MFQLVQKLCNSQRSLRGVVLQSPWVAVHSPSNLTATALRTHGGCSETLANAHGDCAANHIKYNKNNLVDCFVINFILQNNECWKVTVTKEGSTVCSEFVFYVPRTFNRTVPAYRTALPSLMVTLIIP